MELTEIFLSPVNKVFFVDRLLLVRILNSLTNTQGTECTVYRILRTDTVRVHRTKLDEGTRYVETIFQIKYTNF